MKVVANAQAPMSDPVVHAARFQLLVILLQFIVVLVMGFVDFGLWAVPMAFVIVFMSAIMGVYEEDVTLMKERARHAAAQFARVSNGYTVRGYITTGPSRGMPIDVFVCPDDESDAYRARFPDLRPPHKHVPGRE